MTVFFTIIALGGLALSVSLAVAAVRWIVRQTSACDYCPDWEDCL